MQIILSRSDLTVTSILIIIGRCLRIENNRRGRHDVWLITRWKVVNCSTEKEEIGREKDETQRDETIAPSGYIEARTENLSRRPVRLKKIVMRTRITIIKERSILMQVRKKVVLDEIGVQSLCDCTIRVEKVPQWLPLGVVGWGICWKC